MVKHEELREKLGMYFRETGIQRAWFARKVGMPPQMFYQILKGIRAVPTKYWRAIIEASDGRVAFSDLALPLIQDVLKNIECTEGVEVSTNASGTECKISLENFNKAA